MTKETVPGLKACSISCCLPCDLTARYDKSAEMEDRRHRHRHRHTRISSKPINSQAQNRISAGVTRTDNTDTQRDTILSMSSCTHTHRLTQRLKCRHLESYQNLILESKSHSLWFRGGRRWRHLLLSTQIASCMNIRVRNSCSVEGPGQFQARVTNVGPLYWIPSPNALNFHYCFISY